MSYRPLILLVPMVVVNAADGGLANLVYLNDRLELHPTVSAGARYDSNVNATTQDPVDEFSLIGGLGLGLQFAWNEATTLTANVEASLVVTDRPEQRYRNQGSANVRLRRNTQQNSASAGASFARNDDADEQTGERLLVDTWTADLNGNLTGLIHRLSGTLAFNRTDYLDSSRNFGANDRDANTVSASIIYGFRFNSGDEWTLRTTGERLTYDHITTNQNSTSALGLLGWNRQISETIGLAVEVGAEYRHYDASTTLPANDVVSPTWLVNGRTVTANESTWSLTLSGGLQDSINGNPQLGSRINLGYGLPFANTWSLHLNGEVLNLKDVESVAGQPLDDRWTVSGLLGVTHVFRPGLNGDVDTGYEFSHSALQGDYDRFTARAGVTARF